MSEWIEEMKTTTKYFGHNSEGDLSTASVSYKISSPCEALLVGLFTIDELRDLVNHMNRYKGE